MRDNAHVLKGFSVSVRTLEQLNSVVDYNCQNNERSFVRVYVDSDLFQREPEVCSLCQKAGEICPETEWILSLPAILRGFDRDFLAEISKTVRTPGLFSGVMTGSLEGLGYFLEQNYSGKLYADADFYLWNSDAAALWEKVLCAGTLPLELRAGEQRALLQKSSLPWEKIVYGRLPMMVTANCVAQTAGNCRKNAPGRPNTDILWLRDRMGKEFPVLLNCRHCFNVIYNNVPLSLHRELSQWRDKAVLRLQFTVENGPETAECLDFFLRRCGKGDAREKDRASAAPPFSEYTTGHDKRGVQ